MKELVWIDWRTNCRRNTEFCSYFNIEPVVLKSAHYGKRGLLELVLRTIIFLHKNRPCVLLTTSLRIALLAILLRPLFRYKLVVDCHYSGIVPNPAIPSFLHGLYPYIHRHANLVIATNKPHADLVRTCGGRSLVLQDRIPVPPPMNGPRSPSPEKRVVCICSYNSDEPMDEILVAVRLLGDEGITVYFTGDNRRRFRGDKLPDNVVLTGYLPDDQYWQLLWEADLILDLTTRENCLLCGAYEAVAVGKPMVLSNSLALKGYFTKGIVFTENRGAAIAHSITYALDDHEQLMLQVAVLKRELALDWEPRAKALQLELNKLCRQAKIYYSRGGLGTING